MRRAKRITALAVAAAMVLSNVAYAAPDTNTTTTQQGAESLNSQSDASGGVKDQASDTKGNTSTSASQSKEQVKQNESSQSTDPGDQKQTDSKEDVVSQNQDQKKDEDSKETQKPSTEADSQKSETQNVDADKSEDTQEPSKEQEKVLYDITFDTPEKHGRVTDLDGKEVADGKTLKTDENGKAKFKVKPDAGYQVQAVYQMPDEQTPLKLVKDSYYEMQVEKNTTVKVVYQKIPASEEESDGEDDGETKKTDTNQNEVQTPTNEDETNKAAESTDKKATTQSDESDTTGGEPSAGDTNGGISALTISGKNVVYVGEDITLTSDESGGWQHQWEADSGYVTVKKNSDTKATVTGVKAGTATITHSWKTGIPIVGQKSHRETFTVTVVNKLVTSIEIQQDSKKVESLSLNTGDEATLKAVVKPDEATNKNVTWSSSAGDVVQVDNGKLTAVKAGEARITASASDGSGVKAEVKVTVTDVAVKEITVSGEVNQTVLEGGKIQLAVNFVPENATNKGLKWKSLNSDIATVDENGIVTGVRNGTATIQATSVVNPEAVATFSVLVEEIYMTEFTVVADRTTVTVGDTATVRAIIKPDEYPNKEVRWESMDPTVATVNENGVVTTKATGPVTIKGTSKADPNSSATVTILVEDVKAESVTISGYNQNYLTSGSTVTLTATVKPDAAANKTIVWSSSNTDIVTVDQNGKVTAKNQGTATVRALNEYTGLYDEVEIMVYNREPQTVKVHVWVTNQLKTTVNINLPSDGTPVTLTDVLPTYVSSDSEEYVYCGPVYIHNYPNGTGWESIKAQPKAVRLRYLNKNVQYSTSLDGQWNNLRNNNVNAQYELLYSGNEEDDTDVNVVVGDWPYTDGTTTNKILRIRIYNSETGKYDYDSGSMYYDNGSNGAYGKIKFNCDESRYEVAKITVEKYDSRYSDRPSSTTNVEEPVSVEFHKKEEYERYVVTATVQAKEFTVHYDSNGGSNDVPEDQKIKAINGNTVTVASSPQPTKAGYVFAGWSYGGKTYFGGEAFEMPASNVTFVANWIEASQAINYKVNDAAMGTVTRSYERVTSQTSIEDLQGSLATPKDGYHFVKWIDEKGQIVSKQQYFKPTTPEPATYTAVFAIKLNETDFEVSGLSNHVYDGENHKDVPVVTKKGSKDALEEGTDYTVSYDTENFVDVKTITVTITGKGNYSGVVTKTYQITERPIEVTGKQEEFTYDGTLHKVEGVTATNLVEGHKISSKDAVAERTEEGQTNMGLTQSSSYEIKDAGDKDVTKNYSISKVTDGYVKIQRNTTDLKFVEAETTGYNGVYDGAAHDAVTSVKVTGVNGEEIAAEDMTVEYRLSDEADWGKTPQVTDVADSTAVQIRVTVANYDPITTTVQATVTQKPVTITTESASKTYDASALTAPGEVEGIVEGETYGFEITGSQTLVGTSENSYVMTWAGEGNEYSAKSDNYTVTERVGTLTVTDGSEEEPINPEDVVKKTHGTPEGGVYKAGDVVTFTVTATNIYDEVKTITLNEIAGVTLKDTVFADVQPGETVETTATYTITEADVLAGEFVNTVTASFSGEEDTPFEDDDQVDEIEEPKGHLTIDKVTTSEPANGSSYALGETITYKITATNDGNLTLTNVKVVDELTGDEWEIASLAPGASEEFDTSYTVTEADILAGSVVNTATAEGTSPDPDKPDVPVNPGEEEEPTETEKPSLFVEKTAQPDEDGVYNLGDEIHYVIKVTNNGNVTVNDITVKDELTGDEWQLDSLTPGESEEYHATYTVTEEDILAGSITNVATAEGTDPDEDPVDQEGEETVPTDSADSHLTIHKATTSDPGDDGAYDLGDTITYEIIAANDGNVTLNNVIVTDELTGDEWIIETLAPGASETFEAEYVVTEEDIHNGSVVNEATATAEGPEEPVITPGETEDETNPENPSLTVDKSIVEEKDEYEIGDVIEYEITVANNGNVTQNDVRVTDLLQAAGDIVITGVEGADGEIDGANVTLDSLAPGESAIIHCEYTVLKEDRGSTITNAAIADDEGKGDGEDPVTPDVPAEVADVYDINVVHQFADGEEGEAELPDDYTIENQPVGTEREITAETVEGYTVSPASQEVTIEDSDVTITFVYYTDEIGTDPENPDTPDNVPDRYQAVVTFEAVNGTVDRSAAVVTLMRNGQPAEDGIGYLTEDQIATARANVGYAQNSLTWSPGTPTAEYKVTGDMTFTASFSAIPVIPGDGGEEPVEPTNPTTPTTPARPSTPTTPTLPVTPANPGTTVTPTLPVTPQTAAPAARVYADGVVVDDPQTATDDYDLNEVERDAGTETIDEDSTPLGNMDLEKDDDHKCCILHFILLLLALIVELIYTHDRKKRQERIFELRRELADFDETV
ncbi:DUF11 domain-containing protein [Sellimonas intestinalis]|uniref:DUF11 domain-containing protein n=1 Tax=Sellimonas intestinalis TaxID=1653434 RepID=A0A3E3K6M6_9FIRM|nr:Ig-like domain-containing protein [Sellimonas intestinalis]RGD38957.1 DUF11 domain-containing protein [Sellimonas intestinalis]RGE89103.1 DUF11 domain-containing protein [Sellimonas intestinalis]RGE90245.1 DUF11 domain-containing protein [Sellimonas intestinalis]